MKNLTILLTAVLVLAGCTQTIEYKAPAAEGCSYEGINYRYGELFPAADGFNSCSCANDGTVTCSEETSGNPAQCVTDTDCERIDIDTSFCTTGSWTCRQGECDYTCDVSDMLQPFNQEEDQDQLPETISDTHQNLPG